MGGHDASGGEKFFETQTGQAGDEALFAMPLQIYFWTDQPQASFQAIAAAGIIVLLATLLVMNLVAIILRNRYSKRW